MTNWRDEAIKVTPEQAKIIFDHLLIREHRDLIIADLLTFQQGPPDELRTQWQAGFYYWMNKSRKPTKRWKPGTWKNPTGSLEWGLTEDGESIRTHVGSEDWIRRKERDWAGISQQPYPFYKQ